MSGDNADDGGCDAADRAVSEFDERVVETLSWILDTETRARIYVQVRREPWSTSEEVATATGLYPSTVREALAAMTEDRTVTRRKRESDGAGNNPYEYSAIGPSDLVRNVVGDVQAELNELCNLDSLSGGDDEPTRTPVHIEVTGEDEDADPN